MSTRRKRFFILLSVAGGLLVVAVLVARTAGPSWLRGTIERSVSALLGRELKIAGAFRMSFSMTPTLTATNVTLSNASWGSEPSMVRVGRIGLAVDLRSLWSPPIRVRDVTVDDVHVLLEADGDARRNWVFAIKREEPPREPAKRLSLLFEHASVRGFELTYRPPHEAPPLTLGIDELNAGLDPTTLMIDVRGAGHFGDAPWDIAGRIGSLSQIYAGHDLDQALTGHIGDSTLSLDGRLRDPATLGGPHLELDVQGPEVAAALKIFGLRSPVTGPFSLHGALAQNDDGVAVELRGDLGGVTANARGIVDAVLTAERIDATIEAAGPNAARVGGWIGVSGLPPRPFTVSGRIRRDGPRLSFTNLEMRAGGTSVTVGGTLGELPRCVGAALTFAGSGKDLAELSALTRLTLPTGAFGISGRFLRRADGLAIERTTLTVRGGTIHAAGTIGEPPELRNLDMTADGEGPDASCLSGITRVDLPERPFEIRGRVARRGAVLELDDVAGRLGDNAYAVTGRLVPVHGLVGTDAHVKLKGPDLQDAASVAGVHGLPAEPFDAVGRVRVAADHCELDDVDASVGGLTVRVDGDLGLPSARDRTSLVFRARGAALSGLSAWGVPAKLPSDPFAASGRLDVDSGVYRLTGLSAEVGADLLALDGTLGALPDVSALDLAVTASGPSLAALSRFAVASGIDPPPRIPPEAFTLAAQVRHTALGVEVRGGKLGVGAATLAAAGLIGTGDRGLGTDLTFDAEAPDTTMLSDTAGYRLPEGALRARGRLRLEEGGYRFDATELAIGASFAEFSGILGVPPDLAGTDMNVSIEGPDLAALLQPLTGPASLPSDSFEVSAHVAGSRGSVTADRLSARLGDSDLTGTVAMTFAGRPSVDAELSSKHLNVSRLIAGFTREPTDEATREGPAKKVRGKTERLIPDWPLELKGLRAFDGRLNLVAAEAPMPGVPIRNVVIAGELKDGTVTIGRSEGTGQYGGRTTGSLSLRPEGDGYRLRAEGHVDGGRLVLSKTDDAPQLAPSLDVEYEIEGSGRSLHEIAASADGRILVMLGDGRVPNTLTDFMTSNVLIALLDAMNPFRKSSPFTALECGVAAAGIDDGKVVVQPIAVRTDKMTVVGNGKLDLGSERVDLVWTIKPRRGVGITGGSIANPYIKLGGTLADPTLDMKPLEAVASTSAAVVTAGLTILFRGIYDRITAEKNVCVDALAKARKQNETRAARKAD